MWRARSRDGRSELCDARVLRTPKSAGTGLQLKSYVEQRRARVLLAGTAFAPAHVAGTDAKRARAQRRARRRALRRDVLLSVLRVLERVRFKRAVLENAVRRYAFLVHPAAVQRGGAPVPKLQRRARRILARTASGGRFGHFRSLTPSDAVAAANPALDANGA